MEINPVAVIHLLTPSPKHATPMSRCADRRQFVMHNLSSMHTERVGLPKDMERVKARERSHPPNSLYHFEAADAESEEKADKCWAMESVLRKRPRQLLVRSGSFRLQAGRWKEGDGVSSGPYRSHGESSSKGNKEIDDAHTVFVLLPGSSVLLSACSSGSWGTDSQAVAELRIHCVHPTWCLQQAAPLEKRGSNMPPIRCCFAWRKRRMPSCHHFMSLKQHLHITGFILYSWRSREHRDPCSPNSQFTNMRAASFCSPVILQGLQLSSSRRQIISLRRQRRLELHRHSRGCAASLHAAHEEEDIHEENVQCNEKMEVMVGADKASPVTMEWNKLYRHKFFESDSCDISGMLQIDPLKERPTVGVGLTVRVSLSVPVSVLVVMLHFMDAAEGVRHLPKQGSVASLKAFPMIFCS